ncbi:MAG: LamG domain-containing protein [Chloroflexi bacterium]|nr:LamG domain-containing protein [Chloroflexota bacterium]
MHRKSILWFVAIALGFTATATGVHAGLALTPSASPGRDASTGLIAYWKMDQLVGNEVADASGHAHNLRLASLSSAPLTYPSGPTLTVTNTQSLAFDGIDDYAYSFPLTQTAGSPQLTVETWARFDSPVSGNRTILSALEFEHSSQWWLGLNGGSGIRVVIADVVGYAAQGVNLPYGDTTTASIDPNRWHHIAFVYDGTGATNADRLKVFIDGVGYPLTFNASKPIPSTLSLAQPVVRLARSYGYPPFGSMFAGQLDEVRVYTTARSNTDIAADAAGATASVQISAPPPASSPVPGGPVAYWKMDEGTGNLVVDSSGHGRDMHVVGAPVTAQWSPFTPTVITGNRFSLAFDGVDDYTYAVPITETGGNNQLTLESWVRFNGGIGNYQTMAAAFASYVTTQWWFGASDGNELRIVISDIPEYRFECCDRPAHADTVGANLQPGQWYHVAFAYDGRRATNQERLRAYVNGIEYPLSFGETHPMPTRLTNTPPVVRLGREPTYEGRGLDGQLDEVRIYAVARSQTDIASDATGQVTSVAPPPLPTPAPTPVPGSPVAYWKMDEGNGQTVVDSSGRGRTQQFGSGTTAPAWATAVPTQVSGNLRALAFDGVDDISSSQPVTDTAGSRKLTIEGWVNFDNPMANFETFGEAWVDSSATHWWFGINGPELRIVIADRPNFALVCCVRPPRADTVGVNLQPGRWYHVAFVYDGTGSTNADRLKAYVDGVNYPLNYSDASPIPVTLSNAQPNVILGEGPTYESRPLNGKLDEFRIYTVARSSTDIANDAAGGVPQLASPPIVSAGGPYTVSEGSSITLTASATSTQGGPFSFAWDLDHNGSFEISGQSVLFSAPPNGSSVATVTVVVTDSGGLTATAASAVSIIGDPSRGLVLYWKMEAGIGTIITDSAGHGHDLRLTNAPANPTWTALDKPTLIGGNSAALVFDGADNYGTAFPLTETVGISQLTVESWIKVDGALNGTPSIVTAWGLANTQWWFGFNNSSLMTMLASSANEGNNPPGALGNGTSLQDGQWHHVAFVFDGAASANADRIKFYVDGSLVATNIVGQIPPALSLSLPVLQLGTTFPGKMDEVRINTVARSATDIANDAGGQTAPVVPAPPTQSQPQPVPGAPPVYWKMDAGTGDLVVDSSGHGHDLTLPVGVPHPTWSLTDKPTLVGGNAAALAFDGPDDYATAFPLTATVGITQLTVEAWVKLEGNLVGTPSLVTAWGAFNQQWFFGFNYSSIMTMINANPAGQSLDVTSGLATGVDLRDGQWHHLAFVYDGTKPVNADRLRTYADGILLPTNFVGTIPPALNDGLSVVQVGTTFPGKMDEVRIYSVARSSTDIANDAAGATPYTVFLPMLLRNYPQQLIVNTGFESGDLTGWTGTSDAAATWPVRVTDMAPLNGRFSAVLGDPTAPCIDLNINATRQATLTQSISVPASGSVNLTFSYRYQTYDKRNQQGQTTDFFEVRVKKAGAGSDRLWFDDNPTSAYGCGSPVIVGPATVTKSLDAYRGQVIELQFINTTYLDGYYNSWTCVDDVTATVQ